MEEGCVLTELLEISLGSSVGSCSGDGDFLPTATHAWQHLGWSLWLLPTPLQLSLPGPQFHFEEHLTAPFPKQITLLLKDTFISLYNCISICLTPPI